MSSSTNAYHGALSAHEADQPWSVLNARPGWPVYASTSFSLLSVCCHGCEGDNASGVSGPWWSRLMCLLGERLNPQFSEDDWTLPTPLERGSVKGTSSHAIRGAFYPDVRCDGCRQRQRLCLWGKPGWIRVELVVNAKDAQHKKRELVWVRAGLDHAVPEWDHMGRAGPFKRSWQHHLWAFTP